MGYYLRAANSRIALDAAIADGEQREQNHQAIWRALSALPDINLDAERSSERITQGWLELARLMRRAQTDVRQLQNAILDWGTKYANHPVSNTFIDRMLTDFLHTRLAGNKIAVILPLSGQYQLAGEAIQNGFISAYFADKTRSQPESTPVDIHFYDAGTAPASFIQQYQRAKLAGAGMIVGPLDKAAVNELVTRQDIDVPVVTLNYAEDTAAGAANLYQFGLLPEDEARQIAELAIRQKRFHAASLVPDSEWGARIQNAFRERYETLGGRVHSVQQYAADKDDYSYPIRHMLNIDKSEDRRRSIDNIIGEETRFVPYRRQDIDMIFLAATPRAARSIMPALKFHHAADLPVYATSHAYSGQVDKKADRDLNGLIFCDLPWNLVSANPLKTSFSTNWPEQKNYTRLYALGVDTYYLLHNVDYLKHHPYARFSGETGNIRLGDNNRLHRELVCAQFRNDVPVYLDTTLPSEPVIERDSDNS
jgi:outer membrane PBP1 activator LpoA protein